MSVILISLIRPLGNTLKGIESLDMVLEAAIPDEWLRAEFERQLSEEDKAKIQSRRVG